MKKSAFFVLFISLFSTNLFGADAKRKILLFVPGYYGSRLKVKDTHIIRWVNFSDFFLSQKGLYLTIPQTSIVSNEDLVTDDILKEVPVVPFIYSIDSYGKTVNQLSEFAKEQKMEFESVVYDWRADFLSSIKLIDQKIANLNLRSDDELYVVAHSAGGLLITYYLRYGTQDFLEAKEDWSGAKKIKKVVLVGSPYRGLMVLLRDMEHGTSQGLNRNLLSAKDYSTFYSSYFFLPKEGGDQAINGKTNEKIQLNLHNEKNWQLRKWGLFKFINENETEVVLNFIKNMMKRSQAFYEHLNSPVKIAPPKNLSLLCLQGMGKKTIEFGVLENNQIDFNQDVGKVDGDGTVTTESGKPLEFFKSFKNFQYSIDQVGHLELISLKLSQEKIHKFLLEENK